MTPIAAQNTITRIRRALSTSDVNGWEMDFLAKLEKRLIDPSKAPSLSVNESYRLNQIFEKCRS